MVALNLFKNRTTEPVSGDFDAQVTLAKMLNSRTTPIYLTSTAPPRLPASYLE